MASKTQIRTQLVHMGYIIDDSSKKLHDEYKHGYLKPKPASKIKTIHL
jgi:hypothetical protein